MTLRTGALVCAFLFLTGCAQLLEPAAAVVYGRKIPVDEVNEGLDRFVATGEFERLSAQGDSQAIKRQFEQGFLSQLIRRSVLQPKAEELDVEITDQELDARLDEIRNDFPSPAAFQEALKEQGLEEDQLEQLVGDSLLEEELKAEVTERAAPSETELRDYYETRIEDYEQTRAQHVLVENRALADEIAGQAASVPKKNLDKLFARLAKEFSIDNSNAKEGGDLGYFAAGDFVAEFENAAAKLDVGEVSGPVRSEFGFHIIWVTDRRVQAFEDVRPELEQRLAAENEDRVWSDWLTAAYVDAEVKVNPRYGELDVESGQVVEASAEDIPGAEEPRESPTPSVPGG
ncbi:MAG TPA: peptidylprolyl isomerase [Actinomycetota bacterium]|nr:peptidylprolyl isomerase [Actinomycetota bacterium]